LAGESYRVFCSGNILHDTLSDFWTVWDFVVVFHAKMSDSFSSMAGQIPNKMSENP
jgi:hypothetical protein